MTEQKNKQGVSGGAIAGAGGTAAGAGLLGGGIPGFKADSSTIGNIKQGSARQRVGAAASSLRGGIFGYRADAHKGFLQRQVNDDKYYRGVDPNPNRKDTFQRSVGAAKIKPEERIIRHMKTGKKISGVALGAGAAATAYGVHRAKQQKQQQVSKADKQAWRDRSDATNAALVGGGVTAAGGSLGAARAMEHQGRKWNVEAEHNYARAGKIVPNLKASNTHYDRRLTANTRVGRVAPQVTEKMTDTQHKRILAGKSKKQVAEAGKYRGRAYQAGYFGHVYGKTATMARKVPKPALGIAGVGALGLAATHGGEKALELHREHQKNSVSKAGRVMSDAEIRHRKKVQGHISQATGALGLAALGGTLAASNPGRRALRKIPGLASRVRPPRPPEPNPDRIGGATTPVLATSAGLGGIGSFNFASYTGAESKKRGQQVKKSYESLEMGYFGEEGHPVVLPEIVVPIEKAWSPSASNFNSERSRGKRNEAYAGGALVGAGAGATYGGAQGVKAVQHARNIKAIPNVAQMIPAEEKVTPRGKDKAGKPRKPYYQKVEKPGVKFTALDAEPVGRAVRHGGKAAAGLAAAGGAVYAAKKIHEKHNEGWTPYAKRDTTSAFGIDHAH